MDCSMPGSPVLPCLPELAQIGVHWVGSAIQPAHPLLPPSPPALNFFSIRIFVSELALCIRWPNYWSFSFSNSPPNEHSRLISFRIDWLDLLAVQDSQESLPAPRFKSISSSVLSFFFMVQLSYPFLTTGKNSFDYMDLCWQSDVSAFSYAI